MTTETTGEPVGRPVPLHRSRTDRVFAGVCGGIAETYGADPTAVRLLAAIIGIFTGIVPMLVLYLVAAVIVPETTDGSPEAAALPRSRIEPGQGALIFGMILIVAGVAALANELFHVDWDLLWPVALVGVGGLLVVLAMRRERT
jgi:phage shock protein C